MAYSSKKHTGDGVTTDFTVTFDYLDQSHVKVRVGKVFTTEVGSAYKVTWLNSTSIRVDTVIDGNPVPAGVEIEIIRQTPIDVPAVIFGGGASLSSENLNKNSEYLTYALQEATDANEEFTKLYLGAFAEFPGTDNDGDPLQVGTVIYYTPEKALYYWTGSGWIIGESTIAAQAFRNQAEAARDLAVAAQAAAEAAEATAVASAGTASTDATAAAASAAAALASQTAATASETAAAASEAAAAASAAAAATSETNAGTSETNAAASAASAAANAASTASDAAAASASAAAAATSEANAATSEANAAASAATLGGNIIPVGTIHWFATPTAPDGWLVCNGDPVSGIYPDLRTLLINAGSPFGTSGSDPLLPDLRGEFIRGFDAGRGVDSGRVFGSSQLDQMQLIEGTFWVHGDAEAVTTGAFTKDVIDIKPDSWGNGTGDSDQIKFSSANSPDARTSATTAGETRSRNVALLPCIKAYGVVNVSGQADLSALLTTIATQAEAEAGTDNTKLMTPLRTSQAIQANLVGLGINQTWQDFTGSRSSGVAYQNTTGRTITVSTKSNSSSGYIQVSTDGVTWVKAVFAYYGGVAVVPPGHYYKLDVGTPLFWTELR